MPTELAGVAFLGSAIFLSLAFTYAYTVGREPFAPWRIFLRKFTIRVAKFWGFLIVLGAVVHFFSK